MSASRIHLIRHGETASNAARIVQTPETPLSEHGLAQAARLGRRLADESIGCVLSSDLRRAVMTAEKIVRATGAPIALEPLLQERNFGDLRGTAYEDLGIDLFAADYAPPGGETWAQFDERVLRAWDCVLRVAAETQGDLAVVTHGFVCRAMARLRIREEVDAALAEASSTLKYPNTAVTVLRGPAPWIVERLACTAHLDESADGEGAPA